LIGAGGAPFYLRNNSGGNSVAGVRSSTGIEVYMGLVDPESDDVSSVVGNILWTWSGASGGNGDVGQLVNASFGTCMDDTASGVLLAACNNSAQQVQVHSPIITGIVMHVVVVR
jgi:hypothetical protein